MADKDRDALEDTNVVPSPLDEKTHAEAQTLYNESTETLRFIKNHQWKTVGATLITYFGLIVVARFIDAGQPLTQKFMAVTILLATAVIFTLVIYQFWMHNEGRKIDLMAENMSSLFRDVRAIKSNREGNLHRYTLLIFMILSIILGAIVVHLSLNRISLL